jgi:hypothetical protein
MKKKKNKRIRESKMKKKNSKKKIKKHTGAIFAIVARSAMAKEATPGPKNSTNFSTTSFFRKTEVTAKTKSVAVARGSKLPVSLTPITWGITKEIG